MGIQRLQFLKKFRIMPNYIFNDHFVWIIQYTQLTGTHCGLEQTLSIASSNCAIVSEMSLFIIL